MAPNTPHQWLMSTHFVPGGRGVEGAAVCSRGVWAGLGRPGTLRLAQMYTEGLLWTHERAGKHIPQYHVQAATRQPSESTTAGRARRRVQVRVERHTRRAECSVQESERGWRETAFRQLLLPVQALHGAAMGAMRLDSRGALLP